MTMTDAYRWQIRAKDQGQAIRVEYALTSDGKRALRRTTDEEGRVSIERSSWTLDEPWTPYATADFPAPPVDDWDLLEEGE